MPNTNDTQPTDDRTRAQVATARTVAEAVRKTGEKVQSRIIIVENLADTSLVIDQAGDPNTVVEPSAEALSAAALSPIMRRLAALEATPTPAATVAEPPRRPRRHHHPRHRHRLGRHLQCGTPQLVRNRPHCGHQGI